MPMGSKNLSNGAFNLIFTILSVSTKNSNDS